MFHVLSPVTKDTIQWNRVQRRTAKEPRWNAVAASMKRRPGRKARDARGSSRSGCHCTRSRNPFPDVSIHSIASTTPSGAPAVTRRAGAGRFTAWWWVEFTCSIVDRSGRSESATIFTVWNLSPSPVFPCPGIPARGKSTISEPPRATLTTWRPRQMPSTGRFKPNAVSIARNSISSLSSSRWQKPACSAEP